jgi:phosphoserine aminotransferase
MVVIICSEYAIKIVYEERWQIIDGHRYDVVAYNNIYYNTYLLAIIVLARRALKYVI